MPERAPQTDAITGDVIIYAPARDARPNEFVQPGAARCPFCPGHEDDTPPELARTGDVRWSARAFLNKYPMVDEPYGRHEVIVDARDHVHEFTPDALRLWAQRYAEHAARRVPLLFKNSGLYGGATLAHPHTQLVALDTVPPRLEQIAAAQRASSSCITCDEVARSRELDLFVDERDDVLLYVAPSDRFGFALTVVPKSCATDFGALGAATAGRIATLAAGLFPRADGVPKMLNALLFALPQRVAHLHWRLQLIARTGTFAGFELLGGMYVRSATPQESAQRWRQRLASSC